jgi:hypothetical protein
LALGKEENSVKPAAGHGKGRSLFFPEGSVPTPGEKSFSSYRRTYSRIAA